MCGIVGRVNGSQRPSVDIVRRMVTRLEHRGPDHQAVEALDDTAVFGHARLSIIDLSPLGHQPMRDVSGRYTITYNGELYNYRELRSELERLGAQFTSQTDTEVILNAWATWGSASFDRLSGMYAFAIWDARDRELVLARDRFGEKPLYYTLQGGGLTFASELPALLEDPTIRERCRVSIAALNHYLALGYVLSPLTIYEDILQLEPATYLRYRNGRVVEKTRYWDYRQGFTRPTKEPEAEVARHLEHLFDRSVHSMLVADVPIGSFLSGGLDSSGVVAFARRHIPYELHTFSVGFAEGSYDESADAEHVARELHTHHHALTIPTIGGRDLAERAIDCYGEPFSDTSLVPMVEVSRFAAEKLKVALSGDGADEIFGGYLTYRADALHARFALLPRLVRASIAGATLRWSGQTREKVGFAFKAKQFAKGLPHDAHLAHYKWRELHSTDERIAILGAEHRDQIIDSDPARVFLRHYAEVEGLHPLSQNLYVDAKTWLTDDVLVKVDRAAMASSLETRAPFLERQLVEYVASIPPAMKIRLGEQKHILKTMLRPHLPERTLQKKKAGFNAPVNSWYDNHTDDEFRFFNRHVLNRWFRRHADLTGAASMTVAV